MANNNADDYKLPLRQWLQRNTEQGNYGLEWYNRDKHLIKIPWTKNSEQTLAVRIAWARHRGKFDESNPPDNQTLKTNFRGVLDKSKHFEHVRSLSVTDQQMNNFRVYRLLQPSEVKDKAERKRSHPKCVKNPEQNNSIEAPGYKRAQDVRRSQCDEGLIVNTGPAAEGKSGIFSSPASQTLTPSVDFSVASYGTQLFLPMSSISSPEVGDCDTLGEQFMKNIDLSPHDILAVNAQEELPPLSGNLFEDQPQDIETVTPDDLENSSRNVTYSDLQQELQLQNYTTAADRTVNPVENPVLINEVPKETAPMSWVDILNQSGIEEHQLHKYHAYLRYNGELIKTWIWDLSKKFILQYGAVEVGRMEGIDAEIYKMPPYEGRNKAVQMVVDGFLQGVQFETKKADGSIALFGTRLCRSHGFYFDNCVEEPILNEMTRYHEYELFSFSKYIMNLRKCRRDACELPDCEVALAFGKQPRKPTSRVPISLVLEPVVAPQLHEVFASSDSIPALSAEDSIDRLIETIMAVTF
ncbi:uncharacterized protein LOC143453266 [Clavelina lepadiformis]|uniref:uncharacterized protein LOC143453266 n=1 Tax=Clavelina lepadiformis TaxID=159417 RepID=UPI004041F94E